jgi:hypothetical protein
MDIVMISGKQGSGKTTTQKLLGEVWHKRFGTKITYVNFADILYEMHDSVLGILNRYWPRRNIVKDGPLLQMLGTDWGRKTIDEEIWVKCLEKKVQDAPEGLVVIGDCRFENEFDGLPNALRVRLDCPEEIRKQRCSMWRENTAHPSEVGLDRYAAEGRFDLQLETEIMSAADCVAIIEKTIITREWVRNRKDATILNATRQLSGMVSDVNEALRSIEDLTGCFANFQWTYNNEGKKELKLGDVAKANKPSADVVAKAKAEVPDIMQMAESLVGKPVEIKPNDRPTGG